MKTLFFIFLALSFSLANAQEKSANEASALSDSPIMKSWVLSKEESKDNIYVYRPPGFLDAQNHFAVSSCIQLLPNGTLKLFQWYCPACCTYQPPIDCNWSIRENVSEKYLVITPRKINNFTCDPVSADYKIIALSPDKLTLSSDAAKLQCCEK